MAQTAGQIITRATQAAKGPGFTVQAAGLLNAILSDLCEFYDLAVARGLFSFTFASQASSMIGGQNIFASGPYVLPLDYLRTSGSSGSEGTGKSAIWYLNGVPYPMIPCDLAEFDMQVQQAGLNSYPWIWATDMAQRVIVLTTLGQVTAPTALTGLSGIPTYVNGTLVVGNITSLVDGMTVLGPGIPPGTVISNIINPGGLPVSVSVTLSQAAAVQPIAGVYTFGYPGVAYVYPPPSSNSNVNLRYQRQMPDLALDPNSTPPFQLTANASASTPWFPNIGYLERELSGRLMRITDDSRADAFEQGAMRDLAAYLTLKDDDTNRAKTVQLDRRRFGQQFPHLKTTKTIGWC